MKYLYMLRAGIRKILVISLTLISINYIVQLWQSSMDIGDTGSKELDRWEADMQLVREILPIERGTVGYISQEDVAGSDFEYWDNETEFLLTQYALAPLIVKKGLAAEWNVIVLKNEDLEKWLQMHPGEYEITNLKNQIHVLHDLGKQ